MVAKFWFETLGKYRQEKNHQYHEDVCDNQKLGKMNWKWITIVWKQSWLVK